MWLCSALCVLPQGHCAAGQTARDVGPQGCPDRYLFSLPPSENSQRKERRLKHGEISRNSGRNSNWRRISKATWIGLPRQKTSILRMKRRVERKANEIVGVAFLAPGWTNLTCPSVTRSRPSLTLTSLQVGWPPPSHALPSARTSHRGKKCVYVNFGFLPEVWGLDVCLIRWLCS